MKRWTRIILKWIGGLLLAALAVGLLGLLALYYTTESMLNKEYDIQVQPLVISSDPQLIERGKHIVTTRAFCTECHMEDLSGSVFDEGFLMARLVTPNLTSGKGGIGAEYTNEDWVRALWHGVGRDGRTLLTMPSDYFNTLSASDLAAVIAYVRSVPPVDKEYPETTIGPLGRLFILQMPEILPAQNIQHEAIRIPAPEPGVTVEYGKYLSTNCALCHGKNLAGGDEIAGAGVNLTPGGSLGSWSEADFITAMRTGQTPDGRTLDRELMPWPSLGMMTDNELKAIWLFLQTLPAVMSTPTPAP